MRTQFSRLTTILLVFWTLTMLAQPFLLWIWGQTTLHTGMSFAVVIQALTVLVILTQAWGGRRSASLLVLVMSVSYLAELLGSKTGFPFGKYTYTEALQPQLAGVPLLIPLAWLMMLPSSWAVAHRITGRQSRDLTFVFLSALAFTAWDLFLDPQMTAWEFWIWEMPGQYFGIPLVNYLGWLLVSGLITWLARPGDLPLPPLIALQAVTWQVRFGGPLWRGRTIKK